MSASNPSFQGKGTSSKESEPKGAIFFGVRLYNANTLCSAGGKRAGFRVRNACVLHNVANQSKPPKQKATSAVS